jgi:hypothetical protein
VGEVSVPFSDVVKTGEISGSFHVTNAETEPVTTRPHHSHGDRVKPITDATKNDDPQIFLQLQWIPPAEKVVSIETEEDASHVILEEMVRSALLSRQQKLGIVGSWRFQHSKRN